MTSWFRFLAAALAAAPALLSQATDEWSRFRGPNGSGVSRDRGFPAELQLKSATWRSTAVRPGKSSPVLTGKHLFLTGAQDSKLYTQCFDRETGALIWEQSIPQSRTEAVNALNHAAALSPVTDGENVYVFFKDYGLVSYAGASGKLRWKAPLGPFTNVMGIGASPVIAGDKVVVVVDQVDDSFIAGFDRRNGEMKWRVSRSEVDGWGSPLLMPDSRILTVSRGQIGLHAASNGKRLQSMQSGLPPTIVASPILDGDRLYFFGYGSEGPSPFASRLARQDKNKDGQLSPDEYGDDAFTRGIGKYKGNRDGIVTQEEWDQKQRETLGVNGLLAFELDGKGSKPPRELWRYEKSFSYIVPSLVLFDGILYSVRNGGILSSFDAATGKVVKTARLTGAPGGYSASPVAADGKIYFASEDGLMSVVKAGGEWEVLSVADFGEPIHATPALSGGSVFVRTGTALYRFVGGAAGTR